MIMFCYGDARMTLTGVNVTLKFCYTLIFTGAGVDPETAGLDNALRYKISFNPSVVWDDTIA